MKSHYIAGMNVAVVTVALKMNVYYSGLKN